MQRGSVSNSKDVGVVDDTKVLAVRSPPWNSRTERLPDRYLWRDEQVRARNLQAVSKQ